MKDSLLYVPDKNHKWISRTFTEVMHHLCLLTFQHMTWYLMKTYVVLCLQISSNNLIETKCLLKFVAEAKGNRGPVGAGVVLCDEDTNLV